MHGDVDGDGRRDAVYVKARRSSGRCRYWLLVDTGRVRHRKRLRRNTVWGGRDALRRYTRPVGLVRVDRVQGAEIALNRAAGAAVEALAFFTLRDHRLVRMAPTGKRAPPDGLFGYAGSLSYLHGVDCVTKGSIIASAARPRDYETRRRKWWVVKRDSFLVSGRLLTWAGRERRVVRYRRLEERFPEFRRSGLLPHCPGKLRWE
jgi:hypothetical protein